MADCGDLVVAEIFEPTWKPMEDPEKRVGEAEMAETAEDGIGSAPLGRLRGIGIFYEDGGRLTVICIAPFFWEHAGGFSLEGREKEAFIFI